MRDRAKAAVGLAASVTISLATIALLAGAAAAQAPSQDQERKPDLTYVVVDGASIPDPLTQTPGDLERGRAIFSDPAQGGCSACHSIGGAGGDSGPALDGVGGRLSDNAIRLWIVNPALAVDAPKMPAYYTLAPEKPGQPNRTDPPLAPQAIEDLIAYLRTLTAAPPSAEPAQQPPAQ